MSTRHAAVIGHPVTHSLSPAIHTAGFRSTGVDWDYSAIDVPPEGLAAFVSDLSRTTLHGLSVTMPHKNAICALVDEVDATSALLASANTVTIDETGRTRAHTTDGDGFCDALVEAGVSIDGSRFLVLGAGGAARSIVEALVRHRAGRVGVSNRTVDTARSLVETMGEPVTLVSAGFLADEVSNSDVLVNATNVGMGSRQTPLDCNLLRSDLVVVDIVYHPLETELLRRARAAGCATVDGLRMLIHQAVRQQVLWTGMRPDTTMMTEAARRALESRPVS